MPDSRCHRGKHPDDDRLFCPSNYGILSHAVTDFSLLLSKGYAEKSSLKLVGDHFNLTDRQRIAVARCSCSDKLLKQRHVTLRATESLARQTLVLDGYNVLILTESALSGGYIFCGRDGCIRDLAGIHGTYRRVSETIPALEKIGSVLSQLHVNKTLWLLDSPVSNSGRLKTIIRQTYQNAPFDCDIELLTNPDKALIASEDLIATSDSAVLNLCKGWVNFTAFLIKQLMTQHYPLSLVDLCSLAED